ncbi:glycosyltransferase family 2 protein [Flavobacterium sp. 7A]|uniref:glycosyltransferase family 2 protein n=1 Tax=Flavobacterium sp. 7A TaxID=2940571 RepID=UPI00222721C9|nr:glycosyltransferase [Flavobacterium sp. 7A]MCW2119437.1 glycosyltransferase involved in cell wall biosynthesis [Flavobacterium sp. 7A]
MISVVIRNKNQAKALSFLLKNLTERYSSDFNEIIVIDNLSTDDSQEISIQFGARFVSIANFSYGGSANLAAQEAIGPIVVIFSAHSYPVSHDFFTLIQKKFEGNSNLAGLRCLHSTNDYQNYIKGISAIEDPNKSGLIFSGSAFNKKVWEQHQFRNDVATFEDKEWSKRVIENGFEIEFVPSIFHYQITRTPEQNFFRFKNDVVGNYQLWHQDVTLKMIFKGLIGSTFSAIKNVIIELCYNLKRFFYLIRFVNNKPNRF